MKSHLLRCFALCLALWICHAVAQTAGPEDTALAKLGERIFFDKRLSADRRISCGSCHRPDAAFTDGRAISVGTYGRRGTRNAPSIANVISSKPIFWDGRAESLSQQVRMPFFTASEHGLKSASDLLAIISSDHSYRIQFNAVFRNEAPTHDRVAEALVAYVSSLSAWDSPFDRFAAGDKKALTAGAVRGMNLFAGRAQCASCHQMSASAATFTDSAFHPIQRPESASVASVVQQLATCSLDQRLALISTDSKVAALGRYVVTLLPEDIGAFRTPSLRNVALTAPYFHDGRVADLNAAVRYEVYHRRTTTGAPISLTALEVGDLVEFLSSLSSDSLKGRMGQQTAPLQEAKMPRH